MRFDLRLLTIITITLVSLLAFSKVPYMKGSRKNISSADTSAPSLNIPVSSNVYKGLQVFSLFDSAVNYKIYLPPNYSSTRDRYPVLYFLNGPVFSAEESSEEDWRIDELLDSLGSIGKKQSIIVALSGIPLPGADHDSISSFLAGSVKPFIDDNYRTMPLNSVLAGTGPFADVALLTSLLHKQKFARVGVFSPTDSVNTLVESYNLTGAGFSGMVFIYKNGSKQAGLLADNLAANSSALLYTQDKQHSKRAITPFGGWFTEFYGWMMGNGFNYIINTKN